MARLLLNASSRKPTVVRTLRLNDDQPVDREVRAGRERISCKLASLNDLRSIDRPYLR
jgi:hypothetical protein